VTAGKFDAAGRQVHNRLGTFIQARLRRFLAQGPKFEIRIDDNDHRIALLTPHNPPNAKVRPEPAVEGVGTGDLVQRLGETFAVASLQIQPGRLSMQIEVVVVVC
jgi:hypothetical protein